MAILTCALSSFRAHRFQYAHGVLDVRLDARRRRPIRHAAQHRARDGGAEQAGRPDQPGELLFGAPCEGSNIFELGQIERMPTSSAGPSRRACSATRRRWFSSSSEPKKRGSLKWTA
jgi:hypothetical protein